MSEKSMRNYETYLTSSRSVAHLAPGSSKY